MNHQEDWDEHPHHSSTVANPQSWAKRLKTTLTKHWQPEPLPSPYVDHDLPQLTGIERSAEVLRFMVSRLEHWLSPSGQFREFTKMNVRIAIIIAIPVLMVAPLITLAINQIKAWVALLTETFSSFVLFPLSVVLSVLLVCGLIYITRSLMEMRMRTQRRDPYGY
jgi:uncharacterized integral membrane protein